MSPSPPERPAGPNLRREPPSPGFVPPHGGYEDLLSYRKADAIYSATLSFCDRFVPVRSRTHDQMVQAARSGVQNISEGSELSAISKEGEIKLTGVARASLGELLRDYVKYLRHHKHPQWDKICREARFVRRLGGRDDFSYETIRTFVETRPAPVVANILICLIHQANYLLDQQLRRLEQDFLEEGGLRERMTRARLEARRRQQERRPGEG